MAVPTRPVAGAPIESAWGDLLHDGHVVQDYQSGTVTVTTTAAPTADLAVVYPRAYLAASSPLVFLMAVGGNVNLAGLVSIPTVTGFTVRAFKRDGTSFGAGQVLTVYWLAIGPRA